MTACCTCGGWLIDNPTEIGLLLTCRCFAKEPITVKEKAPLDDFDDMIKEAEWETQMNDLMDEAGEAMKTIKIRNCDMDKL